MEFFEILAECSIALAGFGAVHAVLRGSTGARGVYRAWAVVNNGALSFALSILPLVLSLGLLSDELLWRVASTLGLAGALAASYSSIVLDLKLALLGHVPQTTTSLRIGQTLSILSVLAMLLNALGWPWPPGSLLYAVAVTLILITGLNALLASFRLPLQLLLRGEDSESPRDPPAA